MKKLILAAGIAVAACAGLPASAATVFSFDAEASSITLRPITEGCIGQRLTPAACTLTAGFGAGAAGYVFAAGAIGDSDRVTDFIDWTVLLGGRKPTGGGVYDVALTLVFSGPGTASGEATGGAAFGTLRGALNAGTVSWANGGRGAIGFADGTLLSYELDGILEGGLGRASTTGITFTAEALTLVPLPASGWLLLAALGGLAALGRLNRRN
jgi:hypothetical protein